MVNLFEWVQTMQAEQLPANFAHNYGVVQDPERFLAAVQRDARSGPDSPRARWGSLQQDMWTLWNFANTR